MLDKIFASLGLITCLLLAVHMCVGAAQQRRLEALPRAARRWLGRHLTWRFDTRARRDAARQAALQAINRAKRAANDDGLWEGNVYRPKRFEGKPPKSH